MYRTASLLVSLLLFEAALIAPSPASRSQCTIKVYAGNDGGEIAISEDAGETWALSSPSPRAIVWSTYAVDDNIYAGLSDGLAVSGNGGQNWTVQELYPHPTASQEVRSIFAINNRVWATVFSSSSLAVSDDNGQTWPISSYEYLPAREFGLIESVYVVGNRTYVGTTAGLGITDDDGKTWQDIGLKEGLADGWVTALAADRDTVYAGSNLALGTISISQDGGETWRWQNTTLRRAEVLNLFIDGAKVYAATNGGLSISEDGGQSWVVKTKDDGLPSNGIASVAAVGDNIYLGTAKGIAISHDGGQTWATKNPGSVSNRFFAMFAQCV